MANNYTQVTVSPNIPTRLIDDFQKQFLEGYGVSFQCIDDQENPCFYLFMEDSSEGYTGDMTVADVLAANSKLAEDINRHLEQVLSGEDYYPEMGLEFVQDDLPGVEEVLQGLLTAGVLDEIVIEGAFVCSKMRQGELGGFVTRITKEIIQTESTASILQKMRDGSI
jgi:hypothetical protein